MFCIVVVVAPQMIYIWVVCLYKQGDSMVTEQVSNLPISKLRSLYYDWYNSPAIKYEIIKFFYRREMATIRKPGNNAFRMLKCHTTQHFDFLWGTIIEAERQNELHNIYYSLARYHNGIPNQNFKQGGKRDNYQWNKTHYQEMESYDFLIDIDAHDCSLDFAYNSATELKEFFDDNNIPYELRFSGNGFHFIIPYYFFQDDFNLHDINLNPNEAHNIYQTYTKIAKYLHDNFSSLIDWKIYDSRRVCKVPCSLSCYPKSEDNDELRIVMCFPFSSDEQFKIFENNSRLLNLEYINPQSFVGNSSFLFNETGTLDKLRKIVEAL